VVKENEAWQNAMRGIMLRPSMSGAVATRNLVVENVLGENPIGILLFGQPGNTVKENWITASNVAAIDLTGGGASGNLIKENWLHTSAVGVRFGSGWTGNFLIENRLAGNQCAVQGSTAGNTLQENLLVGNGVAAC
jgi:nitrous oxidase accessory protein NosD